MIKKILIVIFSAILLTGVVCLVFTLVAKNRQTACTMEAKICPDGSAVGRTGPDCEFTPCPNNYKNITYEVEGQTVTLENKTHYFGNEAFGDLNGDGKEDIAFLLTQSPGGSGTFFYVAVALKITDGWQGTNAVFLGDRIAPQTTEIRDGEIIVNYAERKLNEPMTTPPSVGVSKYLKIVNNRLVEVAK